MKPIESPFFTTEEAARYLRITKWALTNWRSEETASSPPFRKHGGMVVYKKSELDEWSDRRIIETGNKSGREK